MMIDMNQTALES